MLIQANITIAGPVHQEYRIVKNKTSQKWYVVWNGVTPGIYSRWEDCQKQVTGFKGARFKSFPSKQLAEAAYEDERRDESSALITSPKAALPHEQPALAVDAACSGNPGVMEYRGVMIETGEEVFRGGPYDEGTNNIGEFLGLVHGLRYLKEHQLSIPLYTDSATGLVWLKNKTVKTSLAPSDRNRYLFTEIRAAEKWLQENTYISRVLKWETDVWGEIPADFGRK